MMDLGQGSNDRDSEGWLDSGNTYFEDRSG